MTSHVEIVRDPIDLQPWTDRLTTPECGAVSSFLGVVRNEAGGRAVQAIEYTCYEDMATKELEDVVRRATAKHNVAHAAVVHRVGRLAVGEASLGVVVAAGHRREAILCVLEIIDELKKSVPIWKKEFGPDGSWWV